jgi:3-hydroxyacyl-CoA dehydrogenase
VLGSGLMGSGIACHLAGAGFRVLLLDLASEGNDKNKLVKTALEKTLASKPSPIYHKNFASRIQIGNFDDNLKDIHDCDWIIEVVVEKLEIKKALFEKVEAFRKPGTLITSNTSGIPIHLLNEERSEDFKAHFCGTHFFNPPRYLKLLEIIPTVDTKKEVVDFFLKFGKDFLGKQPVICKDTPAFIANRIGVVSMYKIFEHTEELGLSIGEADKLTGPALGRPKSGTFRLTDIVGLDTATFVIAGLKKNCPDDDMVQKLRTLKSIIFLLENKWYGSKSGKGFYEKSDLKDEKGKPIFHLLDLQTLEYNPEQKSKLESLTVSKQLEKLPRRLKALIKLNDAGATLIRKTLGFLFAYASQRIPEIADSIYAIDLAMKNGFAWELGAFEYWDAVGFEEGLRLIEECGEKPAAWILKMRNSQAASGPPIRFYKTDGREILYYDFTDSAYKKIPGQQEEIRFSLFDTNAAVYKNDEVTVHDIGDGVLCLEFKSKHNAIGEGILKGIQETIRIAEEQGWKGIVIGNNANNFTVGANLMLLGMLAFQQEYDQLDMAVRVFQQTAMRCRYSSIPVVVATQGYVFGGGVELAMHCDAAVCAAESYIGLVEMSVGLLPGGGGTKEFALRLSDEFKEGEIQIPQLIHRFKTIATAAVATSAYEAFDLGYLDAKRDEVSINGSTHIYKAKQKVLQLAAHYVKPIMREDILVLGQPGLAALYVAAHTLQLGGYASEHDIKIAKKIAYVMCGGDLSYAQRVSEQYLLDLEREAFLSLCTEPKTLERIQYMLENNKPLRN